MVPAEDYDLWLRLLPAQQFAKLSDRLYSYRVHTGQSSAARRAEQTARVIAAKLRYVRRQAPWMPWPSRMALPHEDRGAVVFREVGPSEGFEPMRSSDSPSLEPDLVVVTDFSAVSRHASAFGVDADYLQLGNMFVRRRPRAA
jgi:hypothetical protein